MDQNTQSRFITPSESILKNANVKEYEMAYRASIDRQGKFLGKAS